MTDTPKTLPIFIPLAEAAQRTGLPECRLRELAETGRIEAITTTTKEVLVSECSVDELQTKEQIMADEYPNLKEDKGITLTEASKEYDVPRSTLKAWLYRHQYIRIIDEGSYPMLISEYDVAYCKVAYKKRQAAGIHSRIPLLDEQGLPNHNRKYPELAEKRRSKRKRQT